MIRLAKRTIGVEEIELAGKPERDGLLDEHLNVRVKYQRRPTIDYYLDEHCGNVDIKTWALLREDGEIEFCGSAETAMMEEIRRVLCVRDRPNR